MRRAHCHGDFQPKNSCDRFCSAKCRKGAWSRQQKNDLALVEQQLTRALTRGGRRAQPGSEGGPHGETACADRG